MAKDGDISPLQLRQLIRYNPETGEMKWRKRGEEWFAPLNRAARACANVWNSRYAGTDATCINGCGYKTLTVKGRKIRAHRAALAFFHGRWPDGDVDHINGIKTDNRISNLRECRPAENHRNKRKQPGCASSFKGVHKDRSRWRALITIDGRRLNLGSYDSEVEAARAYDRAAKLQHRNFARLNFPEGT